MDKIKDFPILKTGIVYLDSSATTLKPKMVIDGVCDYYTNYSANAHRGDYDISLRVDKEYEDARCKVAKFINAKDPKEIVFTSGSTQSLNMIVDGFFREYLEENDEVLTTKAEHASLILPWFRLAKQKKLKINYIDLEKDLSVSLENVKKAITPKTKVIAIASVTNVLGDVRPIKEICKYAHEHNILVVVDASQSAPHTVTDVSFLDVDFLAFSAHKMLGPTGVGVLYAKEKYLEKFVPQNLGGGMNASFDSLLNVTYKDLPTRLEAGTPNIAGVLGFSKAIDYLNDIGMENVHEHELALKAYMIQRLSKLKNITIYNKTTQSGIVTFNVDGVFAQDVASYLNKKNICVRVGNHCAKILSEVLGVKATIRASIYIYNTKEDIDKLVDALDNQNILRDSL